MNNIVGGLTCMVLVAWMAMVIVLGFAQPDDPTPIKCPTIEVPVQPLQPVEPEDDEYRDPNGTLLNDQIHH